MQRVTLMGTLALGIALIAGGCAHEHAEQDESRKAAAQWLGKDRTQLAKTMGPPKEAVPLTDTGGEMLFYSYDGHHYVFEINPLGMIDSAVQTR